MRGEHYRNETGATVYNLQQFLLELGRGYKTLDMLILKTKSKGIWKGEL